MCLDEEYDASICEKLTVTIANVWKILQLKKFHERVEKCRKDVEVSKVKYEQALLELNAYNAKYVEDMTEVYNRTQEFEEKRLKFFKKVLYDLHSCLDQTQNRKYSSFEFDFTVCIFVFVFIDLTLNRMAFLKEIMTDVILFVSISEIYGQFKQHISELEPGEDLKWWSLHHGVDMPMAWPAFEVGLLCREVFFCKLSLRSGLFLHSWCELMACILIWNSPVFAVIIGFANCFVVCTFV